MDHLNPLDASFLDAEDEDPHASLAVASVAVLDGPAPGPAEFAEAIRGRLPLVPRYRQTVRRVPFDLGPPVWVDDPAFDLDFHLRRTALARPGDDASLERLVGRIMSQRLDRERPLWEGWLIEGLSGGRWAVLSKVHHCMIDGISGNELFRLICDPTGEPRPSAGDHGQPVPATGSAGLTVDALRRLARLPVEQARRLTGAAAHPAAAVSRLGGLLGGGIALAAAFRPAPRTSLSGPLVRARRYAVARIPLADLQAVARARDVRVNDVYLAAIAGAFRRLLVARGERPAAGAVRTLVPVNVRSRDAHRILDNRMVALLVDLPVELGEPADRLRAVHDRITELRNRHEIEAGATLVALAGMEPFPVVSFVVRAALRLPQRGIATVTTNVPGPPGPLRLLGRPVREILPYVPIAERMRIGVAMLTYGGQATVGVTADFAAVPEAADFAAAVADEVRRLLGAPPTGGHRRAARASSSAANNPPRRSRSGQRSGSPTAVTVSEPA